MTCAAWQHRPESSGFVHARSRDPREPPIIQPNFLAREADRRILLAAVRLAHRAMAAPELARYYEREEFPSAGVETDDEWLDVARGHCNTCYHPMGSCRMGPATDPTAVVDDRLRVHGTRALRVVDASMMPTMPSANLNAATLMIAENASDMILGRPPPPAAEV